MAQKKAVAVAAKDAEKATDTVVRVRLRPYRPERGWTLRRFGDHLTNIMFRGGIWYKIDPQRTYGHVTGADLIDRLKTICQNGDTRARNEELGITSDLAFDFAYSEAQAELVDKSYVATPRRGRPMGTSRDPVSPTPTIRSRPGRRMRAASEDSGDDDVAAVLESPPGDEPDELESVDTAGPGSAGRQGS